MKILFVTDSLKAISAYAQQALLLAKELQQQGHDPVVFGTTYYGEPTDVDGIRMLGNSADALGNHRLHDYVRSEQPDVVFTFKDPVAYDPNVIRQCPAPVIMLAPVDTEPAAPAMLPRLNHAMLTIAISRHGQKALVQNGVKAAYAPHAIDTDFLRPPTAEERKLARKRLQLDRQGYMVLFVGANHSYPSRKNIDQLIIGFKFWLDHQRIKDQAQDSVLWLHTLAEANLGGVDVNTVLNVAGLKPFNYRISDQHTYKKYGFSREYMRDLYWAADVLALPSGGEGFGMPVIEAQACGLPVIATDWTAMRDMVSGGYKIPSEPQQVEVDGKKHLVNAGGVPQLDRSGGFRFVVNPSSLVPALNAAYRDRHDQELKDIARKGAEQYAVRHVMDTYWLPLFERIERLIKDGDLTALEASA